MRKIFGSGEEIMILQKNNEELASIIDSVFKEDGLIAQNVPGYKVRESQKEAAEKLICSTSDKQNSIIEGPCGFGKTFVYLSTALLVAIDNQIHYSKKDRPKIVIATSGISLQEQLINKDIPGMIKYMSPMLQELLPPGGLLPTAASFKGRQNFICPLKFTKNENQIRSMVNEKQYNKISYLNDASGDLSKLDFVLNGELREQCVCTSQHDCKGRQCPMYNQCSYQEQKHKAMAADIIVCNYHILYSSLEAPLLPVFNLLIWDEAHEAANIFRDFKTESFSNSWTRWAAKLMTSISGTGFGKDIIEQLVDTKHSSANIFDKDLSTKVFFDRLGATISEYLTHTAKLWGIDIYSPFSATRLMNDINDTPEGNEILSNLMNMLLSIDSLCDILVDEVKDAIDSSSDEELSGGDFDDMNSCFNYAQELQNSVQKRICMLRKTSDDGVEYCYFIKKDMSSSIPTLSVEAMPVDIGGLFFKYFINRDIVNVYTSATLSTGGNLEFCKTQLGLNLCEPEKVSEFIGKSPFNLKEQELWYLPSPCVDGNKPDFENYFLNTLQDLIRVNGKGMLVLTTSISAMNKAYTVVKDYVGKLRRDTLVLKQSDLPRNMLIEEFSNNGEAILVATKSFFTGIDIPGKALQILVIDKLPFNSPDDPVALFLKTKGGNVFMEYSVPNMIITLKQAVGRGVRSITDKCVICIADGRMATARYRGKLGKSFPYEKTSTRDVENIKTFLE